jgi:hypothetical protein
MQIDRIPSTTVPFQLDGYQYRVEMPAMKKMERIELISWIDQTGFKCSTWNDIISTVVYIKNAQDLVFFLLRWS